MTVSDEELRELKTLHTETHARHADQYGPIETCTEPKCLEVKWGIAWLEATNERNAPRSTQ